MYPAGTEYVYSYFESRKGAQFEQTVLFGLQQLLKRHFVGQEVLDQASIDEATDMLQDHFGNEDLFDRKKWEDLLRDHRGAIPIEVKALPEGTVTPEEQLCLPS